MMAGKGRVAGGSLQASPRPDHMSNGSAPGSGGSESVGDTMRRERNGGEGPCSANRGT